MGVSEHQIGIIKIIKANTQVYVRVEFDPTGSFQVGQDVKQSCRLSLLPYNIY